MLHRKSDPTRTDCFAVRITQRKWPPAYYCGAPCFRWGKDEDHPHRSVLKEIDTQTKITMQQTLDRSSTSVAPRSTSRWKIAFVLAYLFLVVQSLLASSLVSRSRKLGVAMRSYLPSFDLPPSPPKRSQRTYHKNNPNATNKQPLIPLDELARSYDKVPCPNWELKPIYDTIVNNHDGSNQTTTGRNIPRTIHMTSKTRCMTSQFAEIIDQWRCEYPCNLMVCASSQAVFSSVDNHSLFLHDDAAVDELLYGRHWPEFPALHQALHCLVSGAAKADIWRALVLYEYGAWPRRVLVVVLTNCCLFPSS